MSDWRAVPPPAARIGVSGWFRIALRLPLLAVTVFGGLAVLLILRLIERPFYGAARPFTPFVTQAVCRMALTIIGLRLIQRGEPARGRGAVVANHASWLDIFVLNACDRVYFVSKAEVARWPGIGWLARATGTVFIARNAAEAGVQKAVFEARLQAGHRLLFFPEGTSTDSIRILPFKSTLFAAFFSEELKDFLQVQPVTVKYRPPPGFDPRSYGWWAEMEFAGHMLQVLSFARRGEVEVVWHAPLQVAAFRDRKALTAAAEAAVRSGQPSGASS